MNEKRLQIYLDDHLALMVGEVELVNRCLGSNRCTPLGDFLQKLAAEVAAQKSVANDIHCHIGGADSLESRVKQGVAWLAEKAGRLKLNGSLLSYSELSRLVELETLAAAAQERVAFWDNLDAVAARDSRLGGIDFAFFRDQSQRQLEELNVRRRFAAAEAFSGR
ncbi:MAG TPA: hypothetical protein VHC19_03130 [Pirellulales bacterium]|nr:hypothetical protein [Pirellulales bacterium]